MVTSFQAFLTDAPGKVLKETTGTAYGNAWIPVMLLEMTTVRSIDRRRETETETPSLQIKKPTTNGGTMTLIWQADAVKKLKKKKENLHLLQTVLRKREHLKPLVESNLLDLLLAQRVREMQADPLLLLPNRNLPNRRNRLYPHLHQSMLGRGLSD